MDQYVGVQRVEDIGAGFHLYTEGGDVQSLVDALELLIIPGNKYYAKADEISRILHFEEVRG